MTPEQVRGDWEQVRGGKQAFTPGAVRLAGLLPRMLGWRPDDVWSATPAELAAILDPACDPDGAVPLSRAEFEHLLEKHPDGR